MVGFIPRIALFEEHALENTANQESRCILDDITPNLPIMRRAHVTMIVLATIFSTECYRIVIQRSLMVYHDISHSLSPTMKIQVARKIFHGITLKSAA